MKNSLPYRNQWKDKAVMRKLDEQYGRAVGKTDKVLVLAERPEQPK